MAIRLPGYKREEDRALKKLLALILAIALTISIVLPANAADPALSSVTASINNSTRNVSITGTISTGTGKNVTIVVTDPNGILNMVNQVVSTTNGSFSLAYTITSPVVGEYAVKVSGEGIGTPANTTFTYAAPSETNTPAPSSNPDAGGGVLPPASTATPTTVATATLVATATPAATVAPTSKASTSAAPTSTPKATVAATATPLPQEVKNIVDDILDVQKEIEAETDVQAAKEKIVDIIVQTSKNIVDLEKKGVSIRAVEDEILNTANILMKKINTEIVTSEIKGEESKTVINAAQTEKIIDRIDQIVSTTKELNDKLGTSKKGAKIEAVLEIKVESGSQGKDIKKAGTTIPVQLLKTAGEKKIDKVSIDTGVAKISIPPSSISTSGTGQVQISAERVDVGTMSKAMQLAVGKNPVFDFNLSVGDKKVSSFKKHVQVDIPYTLKEGENPKNITVFFVNDKGQLENVAGVYDEKTKSVGFSTKHFSKYVVKYYNVTFNDIEKALYKDNIEELASKGIITGYASKFEPTKNLTRAEFVTLIVRAFKLEDATAVSSFKDVKKTDWYYKTVSAAVKAGLVSGRPDKTFAPNEKVSRQDMAVIAANVLVMVKGRNLPSTYNEYVKKFNDGGTIANYAKQKIALLSQYSIINPNSQGMYLPAKSSTKDEAANIIYNLFYMN